MEFPWYGIIIFIIWYFLFCLTRVLANTKYIHAYVQEQVWEYSAVKATNAKSLETSKFQHKFHGSDAEIQMFRFLLTSQSHNLSTTALPAQGTELEKACP